MMIGLRDTRNKPAIVFNQTHALAEPTLVSYAAALYDVTVPQIVYNLTATTIDHDTVFLNWDDVIDTAPVGNYYKILMFYFDDFYEQPEELKSSQYTWDNLTQNTLHRFKVRAYINNFAQPISPEATATTQSQTHVIATADLLGFLITEHSAEAFQRLDVTAVTTLETYSETLFDAAGVGEIVALPNLVPVADVAVNDWTVAPLWSKVNTPGSTTSWIASSNGNGSSCRLRLSVPNYNAAGVLRFFRRKTTGNDPTFVWELFRNGVSIQTNSVVLTNTTFIESTYPLTENIVSGATYEVVCTRSGGGSPTQRGILEIASLYIDPV